MIDFDGINPRHWIGMYFERRICSANKAAKLQHRDPSHAARMKDVYAQKNLEVNFALRYGLARVAIDDSCHPTDVSIRFGCGRVAHIPASEIEPDVHRRIVEEAGGLGGISMTTR